MAHPLSKAAVEAAAAKLYAAACEQRGVERAFEVNDWEDVFSWPEFKESVMAGMNAALSAAFEQARAEGNARDGSDCKACWNEGSEAWVHQDWDGPNFPVTIIRNATP